MRKFFWVPVWLGLAVLSYFLGISGYDFYYTKKQQIEDASNIARVALHSPSESIRLAEEYLRLERIDFDFYRQLIGDAIESGDRETVNAANLSVARVLATGLSIARRMDKELKVMPAQVYFVTSGETAKATAKRVGDALASRESAVVKSDPEGGDIKDNAVYCYDQTVCDQLGKSVVSLLQEQGVPVNAPVKKDGGSLFKRVDVFLASTPSKEEPKTTTPAKPAAPVVRFRRRR